MPRPILLGIAGDSAAGKTTLTRGLVRILGEAQVTHVSADHYHRYDRRQRAERRVSPLHPDCNHLDVLEQDLAHIRADQSIFKPVYRHQDGTFGAGEYVSPATFTIVEGLLAFHTPAMRDLYDVRVYVDPPEDLRRTWKVQRDCSRRGYTTDQVLEELDRREADAESYVRPQQRHADLVISFLPGDRGDQEHLDAKVTMRPGLVHPDLSALAEGGALALVERGPEVVLWVPGTIAPEQSAAIEEAIWEGMHFASHLRTERLGEFTVGTRLHRSESLAITQLLVLYQLVTARAAVAIGAVNARTDRDRAAIS
ncbi:MAG TPA: phosphoribulokinase [Solirubrobacteraceae bacterium]|nr:phosphoribulokinase [Solirubrobacteraceae bacterium]